MLPDLVTELRRREVEDRPPPELSSDDRSRLDDRALLAAEPVEPGREQRLDRRRHRQPTAFLAFLDDHRHQLLDEERVSLGRVGNPLPQILLETVGVS